MKRMEIILAFIIAALIGSCVFKTPDVEIKVKKTKYKSAYPAIQTRPAASAPALSGEQIPANLVRVSDGDTVWLKNLDGGEKFKVRLYGIDAPESTQGQPFGKQASKRLAELLSSEYVYYQLTGQDTRWGRVVAKVWDEHDRSVSVNEKLVSEGLAWHYRQYAPNDTRLAELQAYAQTYRLGLWQDDAPVSPWDWRHNRMGNK